MKARLSLAVVCLVLATTFAIATVALALVKQSLKASVAKEQFVRLSAIADAIDQKFVSRRTLLKTFGDGLQSRHLVRAEQLQDIVEQHTSLNDAFDSLFILDRSGLMVASMNFRSQVGQLNLADRRYFVETLATRTGLISQPFNNRISGRPQIVMTQPVMDGQGEVAYVLGGSIHLHASSFLGEFAQVKFGSTGYLSIFNTDGIVVDHPSKQRILKHYDAEGGTTASTRRALAGFEGTSEAVSRTGVPSLYAHKRIRQTNWILAANYPRAEAFAPIEAIERSAWLGAVLLALIAGGLALVVIRRAFDPLSRLHEHMLAVHQAPVYVAAGSSFPNNEIGDLADAFDALMRQRQLAADQARSSEQRLRMVLTQAGDAFISIDREGAITEWNRQAEATFGWTRSEVLGRLLAEVIVPAASRDAHNHGMRSFVHTGQGPMVQARVEVSALHRNGQLIPVEVSVSSVDMGDHFSANAFVRDITERKAAEAKINASERFLRAVTDNLPVLITYIDHQRRLLFANDTFMRWTGIDVAAAIGRPMEQILGKELYQQRRAHLEAVFKGQRVDFDIRFDSLEGVKHLQTTYVPDLQADGFVAGAYCIASDISAQKLVEERLDKLSRVDLLTQLPNRREFQHRLEQAMARSRRNQRPMALIYLDIDRFKQINDTHGHGVGDAVLREFALRLQHTIRGTDTAARLAGDEFVVILEGLNGIEEANAVARKLGTAIRQPLHLGGLDLAVTSSMGFAFFEGHAGSVDDVIARADRALYRAKAAGRDAFAATSF